MIPAKIKWGFPPTNGGYEQGFNDASEEFFKAGVLESMTKEVIQNSLDARRKNTDGPVRITMTKTELGGGFSISKSCYLTYTSP